MRTLLALLSTTAVLHAQNLVVNPGFEENYFSTSPEYKWVVLDELHPHGWSMPTIASSDIYVVPDTSDPLLNRVRPAPFEGKSYAAFINYDQRNYYEYIEGSFTEPLKANITYTVSLAVGFIENREPDLSGIGFVFTNQKLSYPDSFGSVMIPLIPAARLDTATVSEKNEEWKVYSFLYTAKGGENYFTIGDFGTGKEKSAPESNYFYIDSVSVTGSGTAEVVDTARTEEPLIAAGKTLTLTNIYFETGQSKILPDSYQPLYEIIVEMKLQPDLKVEITGHTDNAGSASSNQTLSEQRAEAVKQFFIDHGIDASRITTRGAGNSRPVSDDRSKNRRVEFRFYQ